MVVVVVVVGLVKESTCVQTVIDDAVNKTTVQIASYFTETSIG